MTRKFTYSALAILAVLIVWLGMRVMSPALAYYPPEIFVQGLPPSMFVENGIFVPVFITYLTIALVLQFLVFAALQSHLTGTPGIKGLIFGTVMGVLWAIAFMSSIEFFGTTVRAEIINGIVDIIPLALAGWFSGLIWGTEVPRDSEPASAHLLAIPIIALTFVIIHSATNLLVDDPASIPARLMFTPHSAAGFFWIAAFGAWSGVIYVVLRSSLPTSSALAHAAVFAVVVFGHTWFWFNMFFNNVFSEVLTTLLSMVLIDIAAVFVGVFAYEKLVHHRLHGAEPMVGK